MRPVEVPRDEPARLRALRSYDLLDTPPEPVFDALTALAAKAVDAPVALLALVDADRVWFKSRSGTEDEQTARANSLCAHVVQSGEPLVVRDTAQDERFSSDPRVTSQNGIRFYAGVPLRTQQGFVLGALCVIDHRPRELRPEQRDQLLILAGQILGQLEARLARRDERKRHGASERLAATQVRTGAARFGAMIDAALDAIVAIDDRGRIDVANPAFETMFGYTAEQVIGRNVRMLMPSPVRELHDGYLAAYQAGGSSKIVGRQSEVTARREDGTTFPAELSVTEYVVGGRRRFTGVIRDLTRRRAAAERIESLASVVEQTGDCVVMTDRDGRIEYVNGAFTDLTGWTSKEAMGQTPRILKSGAHDEAFYRGIWDALKSGEVFRGTIQNRRKDGTTFYAEQTITPIRDGAGETTHFVSVMKDETERRLVVHNEAEFALAAGIQRRLYPQRPLDLPDVEIGGFVLSASATCGDYYDWVPLGDGHAGIVVGDVAGHGLGPALIMAETRAYLRSLVPLRLPPHDVLGRLDGLLKKDLGEGQFVTMLLIQLDLPGRRLTYANAGHVEGRVLDAGGALKASLGTRGPPLGLWWDAAYPDPEGVPLEPGDLILMLSDGVTEARDALGNFLEDDPVIDVVRRHSREPVPVILDRIREMLSTFRGGLPTEDDATVVVCRVLGDAG